MGHRVYRNLTWLLAWSLLLPLLGGCSQPMSDEASLRHAVAEIEKAAEARQTGPILDYLDDHFTGNEIYRKTNMRAMLLFQFRQNPHVHVFLHITQIQIRGETAKLACEILLAGRDKRVLPERARAMVVDTLWQKRDGNWRVLRARWRDPLLQP